MKKTPIVGIVCEYNPFHLGHKLQIIKIRESLPSCKIVCVMSGNFVQRGEPSLVDKWTRTEYALKNGVDLVLELPTFYVLESAENFAKASVKLLNDLGFITHISFGSETANVSDLQEIANVLHEEPPHFKEALTNSLSEGNSYKQSVNFALKQTIDKGVETPNDTLAIQYLKTLLELNSPIIPLVIKREASNYHSNDLEPTYTSATSIRLAVKNNNKRLLAYLPENVKDDFYEYTTKSYTDIDNLSSILHYKLSVMTDDELCEISHIQEGLHNRIKKSANENFLISSIVDEVSTKRYTKSKVRRAIMCILLDIKKSQMSSYNKNGYCQYARVLGYKKESVELVSLLSTNCKIPYVMNVHKCELDKNAQSMLDLELMFTRIYNLAFNKNEECMQNFNEKTKKIVIM